MVKTAAGLFAGLEFDSTSRRLQDLDTRRLIDLAALVARARSAVERDPHSREIELIYDSEAPARLAQALRRLYVGMLSIGLERDEAFEHVVRVGLDCLPKLRRGVFDQLAFRNPDWRTTVDLAASLGYPTTTARRSLEDLAAHGVVERRPGDGKADLWQLGTWARARLDSALTVPETSVPQYTHARA